MNKSISLTVDTDDYNALTRASDMLHGMAQDLKNNSDCGGCDNCIEKTIPAAEGGTKIDNKEVEIDIKREDYSVDKPAAPAQTEATTETPATPAGPVGVELDSDGLPHDSRIHSRNKTKLAKTQQWKKARGVDPQLVLTVEAELRQAMAIPAATTETPASPAAPAIVETAIPASPAAPATPAIVETGTITTFPELMAKITAGIGAGTLSNDQINAVCIGKGLASLPLVAARPDLIPAIAAELFPNG